MTFFRVLVSLTLLALGTMGGRPALAQTPVPPTLQVPLFPGFDQYGNQFEVVQAFDYGGQRSITSGIYDTGASLVSFSALDQEFFFGFQGYPQIPLSGATDTADAIGGTLTGDVSRPGTVLAAGGSSISIDFNNLTFAYNLSNPVSIGGIQALVGKVNGSPDLPTILGTPINAPTATRGGLATVMDQRGYTLDLGFLDPTLSNIQIPLPDVRFANSGVNLTAKVDTYEKVTIPVSLFGPDNLANPGTHVSAAPNPMQSHTAVAYTPAAAGSPTHTVSNQNFLFDTGAQLSIISPAIAAQLGLTDLAGNPLVTPVDTIDVQGAGDKITGLPGYILDSLSVPRADGGLLQFTDVPVYVLDVGFGIDGILGMNLFNGADSFVYDPYNVDGPQVSVLFLNDRTLEFVTDEAGDFGVLGDPLFADANALFSLLGSRYTSANIVVPGIHIVPEPSTLSLGLIGLMAIAVRLRRRIG